MKPRRDVNGNKCRSCSGETLVELLVAILIGGLSVALLATMITTAGRWNYQAQVSDAEFYRQVSDAETRKTEVEAGKTLRLTLTRAESGLSTVDVNVTVYGTADGLVSYGKAGSR